MPPVSRYQCISAALFTIFIFFINVYILYDSAPNYISSSERQDSYVAKQCDITDQLALSALERVKSESCRAKINEAACALKEGTFHDTFPESDCDNHDSNLVNQRVGCYQDYKDFRVLTDYQYEFPTSNSRDLCRKHCYRAGYVYYGLEYARECFCGNNLVNATMIDESECRKYRCPQSETDFCGGFNAIEVFRTGYRKEIPDVKPKYIEGTGSSDVKILFLLQLNGRNDRQVKRFLKSVYCPKHYFLIHIDKRQRYMQSEMEKIAKMLPNVVISDIKYSTIWGGASLLEMFLDMIRFSLEHKSISDWDYIINFSESDFPVLPIHDVERILEKNKGYSFLASHGQNTAKFIQKQGFDYAFLECDERMWRIGKRESFPANIRIDGGSDWVVIHKSLAKYSISNEELPLKMRKLFRSIILPLESFYHTLSKNTKFCDKVLYGNLRLTNWNRKQGCRCAGLKKVVDWCGCSPLVFRTDTMLKFVKEKSTARPFFFARKFDSLVNVDAIAFAESLSVNKSLILNDHPSYNSSFSNIYSYAIDGDSAAFKEFAKSLVEYAELDLEVGKVSRIDVFRQNSTSHYQIVVSVESDQGTSQFLIRRKDVYELFKPELGKFVLENATFGSKFDYKEEICRDFAGYVTEISTVQLRMQWKLVHGAIEDGKTSPEVELIWRNADGGAVASTLVKPYDSVFGGQFGEVELNKFNFTSSTCGPYSVLIRDPTSHSTIAIVKFPVFSQNNSNCHLTMAKQFYNIDEYCVDNCDRFVWSTFYPDPKSDILYGYNDKLHYLE